MSTELACPVCKSQLVRIHKLRFNVYKCAACKVLHSDATFDYSFSPALNEERRAEGLKTLRFKNFRIILDELAKIKPDFSGLQGLEIGAGNGWWLQACKAENINCIGIEPEIIFNDFYEKHQLNVVNGFYPDPSFTEKSRFDFIIFNDVFEHISEIENLLLAIKSDLSKDGLLIINIPMSDGLFYRLAVLLKKLGITSFLERMWQFNFPSPHINYFNSSNLKLLLQNHDFEIIKEQKLLSIDTGTVKERILSDKSVGRFKATIFSIIIKLISPIVKWSKPDIKVFLFRNK